jgi:hypothetical protein
MSDGRLCVHARACVQLIAESVAELPMFLSALRVPRQVELHIKNWIRFQYPQQRADAQVCI